VGAAALAAQAAGLQVGGTTPAVSANLG